MSWVCAISRKKKFINNFLFTDFVVTTEEKDKKVKRFHEISYRSIQHLKNRFGSGYTLTVRCMGENTQALTNFVQEQISDAILKDSQLNQLQFHLPLKTTKLPSIFR